MSEYEQTQTVGTLPDDVFAWLSDVGYLPAYLPPVVDASMQGPSAGGMPGRRVRTALEYPGGGETFDAEGYFAMDEGERRMEWGAEAGRDYSGWLTVAGSGGSGSEVTVHLAFGERSVEGEMQGRAPEGKDPLARGIAETLESIRRRVEEGSGKAKPSPPPPGAEPPTDENPAVVRDDPRA